jgi:hypothetical protein
MDEAIAREKQIKGGSRQKKIDLIKAGILNGKICMRISLHNFYPVIASLREVISRIVYVIASGGRTPSS